MIGLKNFFYIWKNYHFSLLKSLYSNPLIKSIEKPAKTKIGYLTGEVVNIFYDNDVILIIPLEEYDNLLDVKLRYILRHIDIQKIEIANVLHIK